MTKTAMIIYNPRSGRQSERQLEVERFSKMLANQGYDAQPRTTQKVAHATELAAEAVASNVDLVVGYGGDGTLNEILQGMVGSRVPLAIWPGGTANVVALDLKLPRTPETIAQMIATGSQARICVGKGGGRYFFFSAGIGLDAEIIEAVDAQLKKTIGKGAFWLAGFSHLVKWNPEPITVKVDSGTYQGTFVVVGKSFGYGGTLSLTPHARFNEPMLDVCIFTGNSKLQYLSYLVSCLKKKQLEREGVIYLKTTRVEASAIIDLPVQLDGELAGRLPMNFEVVPDALTVFVPPGTFN